MLSIQFNKFNPFLLGLLILLLLICSLLTNQLSIFLMGLFWLFLGILLIKISFKQFYRNTLFVFYFFYLVYATYSFLTDYFYVKNPSTDFFYAKDSLLFFQYSNELSHLKSGLSILKESFSNFLSADWKGFAFLTGLIGHFGNMIDENNMLIQKLIIVFFSAMILPFIYQILLKYVSYRSAFSGVILYGLLSYSLFYSAVFIRDVIIGFLFIVLIYNFFCSLRLSRLYLFFFITILIFLFRPQHGIFSLLFTVFYLFYFLRFSKKSYRFLLFFPFAIIVIWFFTIEISSYTEIYSKTTEVSTAFSLEKADSSSIGAKLLTLPPVFREISVGIFSQMLPFPFYLNLGINGLGFIPLSIAAIFWFFIWVVIFTLAFDKKKRKKIDFRLWILFVVAILLILSASGNADVRRIMAVYPIIFIIAQIELSSEKNGYVKYLIKGATFYTFFLLVYNFIKYF